MVALYNLSVELSPYSCGIPSSGVGALVLICLYLPESQFTILTNPVSLVSSAHLSNVSLCLPLSPE